jgi:hypothetical protein
MRVWIALLISIIVIISGVVALTILYNISYGEGPSEESNEHGCPASGGYTWNESIGACVREWELGDNERRVAKIAARYLEADITIKEITPASCTDCYEVFFVNNENGEEDSIVVDNWEVAEDNEVVYKIYVDDEHESWFTIIPDEISLAPQQSGEIEITVSPPLTTIGEHTAFVYITSAQPSSGLQVALGIKLKANITIDVVGYGLSILQDILPYLIIGVLGIVTLVIFIFVVIRPKIRRY